MENTKIVWTEKEHNKTEKPQKNKFVLALLLALVSTFVQFFFFKIIAKNSSHNAQENVFPVALADKNLKSGEMLQEENIKFVYMDVGKSKEHFILSTESDQYFGQKIVLNIKKNSPILKNVFFNSFQKNSLPEKIPYGKRLFVLEINLGALSSLVRVGDKVDVIAHLNIPGFGKATETVLSNAEIIGIGTQMEHKAKGKGSEALSFYVNTDEVKILSFMKQYALFTLALRNPNDPSTQSEGAVTFNKFIQDKRIQQIIQNDSFQVIQGNQLNEDSFMDNQ
jgi:Flp pilus assembly protein CpaB